MLKPPASRRTGATDLATLIATGTLAASLAIALPAWAQSDEGPAEERVSEEPISEDVPDQASEGQGETAADTAPEAASTSEPASDNAATSPSEAPATEAAASPDLTPDTAAAGANAKGEIPGMLLDKRNADYYDRRAEELLKEDAATTDVGQHPLASAYPNEFVVVCEAGCRGGAGAEIVAMVPRPAPKAPEAPAAQPAGNDHISCVGGCGTGPAFYQGPVRPGVGMANATIGEWMTTVAEIPAGSEPGQKIGAGIAAGSGSGDWMKRINAARGETAPAPTAPSKSTDVKPTEKAPVAAKSEPKAPIADKAANSTPEPKSDPTPDVAAKTTKPETAKPATTAETPSPATTTAPADNMESAEAASSTTEKPAASTEAKSPAEPATTTADTPAAKSEAATEITAKGEAPSTATPADRIADAMAATSPKTPETLATPAATETQKKIDETPAIEIAALDPKAAETVPETKAKPETSETKDKVISVLSEDKDMNAAIEKARASLDTFWRTQENPGPGESDFALKVAISGNGATEHFWLTEIRREGDKITGLISNEPQSVKTVRLGQPYTFTSAEISDWTFKRNGKLVGNETMRILLPRMSAEQAAVYRNMYETP
ncbi:MAG: DUF2314 domain-containing protein [Hyphomicrobium sp.]|nr:DUF2314 domain-containing protein [Hyphomicrobium sp.]